MKIKQCILKLEEVTKNNTIYSKNSVNPKDLIGKPVNIAFNDDNIIGIVKKCWIENNEVWVECYIAKDEKLNNLTILSPSFRCDEIIENKDGTISLENFEFLSVAISNEEHSQDVKPFTKIEK